ISKIPAPASAADVRQTTTMAVSGKSRSRKRRTSPQVTKFRSTKQTQMAAHLTALGIGNSILEHIADCIAQQDHACCFEEDGSPTEQTFADISEWAEEALQDWLVSAAS